MPGFGEHAVTRTGRTGRLLVADKDFEAVHRFTRQIRGEPTSRVGIGERGARTDHLKLAEGSSRRRRRRRISIATSVPCAPR